MSPPLPQQHLTLQIHSSAPAPVRQKDVHVEKQPPLKGALIELDLDAINTTPIMGIAGRIQDTTWIDRLPPTGQELLRLRDWTATPLGHPSTWPHALRLYTHMLFAEPRAAILCWGRERTTIYNEKWIPLLGHYHPDLLGGTFEQVMPPVYAAWQSIFTALEAGQLGMSQEAWDITQNRTGWPEESFWDGIIVGIKDDTGGYGGMYSTWTDITKSVHRDRRSQLLMQLNSARWDPTTSVWQYIHQGLLSSPRDVTMAIIYGNPDECPGSQQMLLQHSIGLGPACSAAPPVIDLSTHYDSSLLGPLLRRARDSEASYILIDQQETPIDPALTEHIEWRGFGEPSRYLVIIPLHARSSVQGYCVLGLNPRRAMDQGHEAFLTDLSRELCDIVRKSDSDDGDQERRVLREQNTEHERRIRKLVEVVPCGVYTQRSDGSLIWANQRFYQIMGVPFEARSSFHWTDYISPLDHEWSQTQLENCLKNRVDICGDIRLNTKWTPPAENTGDGDNTCWIYFSACPEPFAQGDHAPATMGCVIDITQQKWSEGQQQRNVEQARAEKRKLEDFIDITSHEMRNPLSAILQCAESLSVAMGEMRKLTDSQALLKIIQENEETTESILLCVAHQRRIVDDILTLSKLNSQLLTITPTEFNVQSLVDESIRMLGSEFDANSVSLDYAHDMTSSLPAAASIYGDSARLLQVLVNLLTNAMKFTKKRPVRKVSIRTGIVDSIPLEDMLAYELKWSESPRAAANIRSGTIYPPEEAMYLYFTISDTGIGVPPNQVHKLFSKFEQGNLITFTKYGGSGLGLYISRELTELHGGRIGLSSVLDVGSTFAFYIQVRRPKVQLLPQPQPDHPGTAPASRAANAEVSQIQADAPITQRTVLLVEDNLLNQKILAKQLVKAGCIVLTADHGGQAVDCVLQMLGSPTQFGSSVDTKGLHAVNCILMDWEMPVCDGLQATKKIREIETSTGCAANTIVGITANAREGQIIEALAAGMDSVVTKPFKVAQLIERLDELATGNAKKRTHSQ